MTSVVGVLVPLCSAQNRYLWKQYQHKKQRIAAEVGAQAVNERWLWHGTCKLDPLVLCQSTDGLAFVRGIVRATLRHPGAATDRVGTNRGSCGTGRTPSVGCMVEARTSPRVHSTPTPATRTGSPVPAQRTSSFLPTCCAAKRRSWEQQLTGPLLRRPQGSTLSAGAHTSIIGKMRMRPAAMCGRCMTPRSPTRHTS